MESPWKSGEFNPNAGPAAGTTEPVTRWPSPEQQRQDIAWTVRVPRPKAGDCADYLLGGRQEQWDESEAKRLAHEAAIAEMRAERAAVKEKAAVERDAAFQAAEVEKAKQREEHARIRYLAAGGSDWEQDKDAVLRAEVLRRMDDHQGGALISPREMVLG